MMAVKKIKHAPSAYRALVREAKSATGRHPGLLLVEARRIDDPYFCSLALFTLSANERLDLSEAEVERFTTELNAILGHVEKLQEHDVTDVPPTSHPLTLENVMREDVPRPSLPPEAVLANAPEREAGGFKVPPVIEQH